MANYTPNLTFSTGEYATSTKINNLLNNVLAIYPVGALLYIHQPAPTGAVETTYQGKWIQCNGAVVSRTTYSGLFNGPFGGSDVYGGGDGSTTFGLPDLRGRAPVSIASGGHADVRAFGDNEGAALANRRMKHAHTFAQGTHSHTWSGSVALAGAHTHTYLLNDTNAFAPSGSGSVAGIHSGTSLQNTSIEVETHTHTFTPTLTAATSFSGGGDRVGVLGTPADEPAYIVAGCWYMAYQ